ncbi:MAG TPA: RNA polymerase sigma factor [Vicinamibacterales bacterium]|nr:RNA polymerase sigma factor [Vicinamibacterales bacterium]
MSGEFRTVPVDAPELDATESPVGAGARRRVPAALSDDSRIAMEIRGLVERGDMDEARERFAELVAIHQRRASRIAYQYLRDGSEADEAVQDAFVKAFSHIGSYRETWPFEVWFTRILINGCLDRRKARSRRDRWFVATEVSSADEARAVGAGPSIDPEHRLLARERRAKMAAAIDRLDGRQRTVFMLCHYGDCTPREVSAMTGLNESTVRVHLFRAVRKLRALLGGKP